jgi:diadenylate cyclase
VRHWASEISDAIAVVVSEETGSIAIAHAGRMLRRLDTERLENILTAFFRGTDGVHNRNLLIRLFPGLFKRKED